MEPTTVEVYFGYSTDEIQPTVDPEVEAMFVYYKTVEERLWRYAPPILLAVGTVGNGLTLLVLLGRKGMRTATSTLYLLLLAVLDTVLLYTGLLRYYIHHLVGDDVRSFSHGGCKFHIFLVYFTVHLEAWMLVNMTLERLVAVLIPHKVKLLFSRAKAILGIMVTGTVLLVLDLHFFWTFTLVSEILPDGTMVTYCGLADTKHKGFLRDVWPWLDMTVASVAPFVIISVCNLIIIVRILCKNEIAQSQVSSNKTVKMTSMTAILISVSLTFLLLTMPICIFFGIEDNLYSTATNKAQIAKYNMIFSVMNNLYYLNNSINFFLYCLTGPRFRRELRALFRKTRVTPIQSNSTNTMSATV